MTTWQTRVIKGVIFSVSVTLSILVLELMLRIVVPYRPLPYRWATGTEEPVYRVDRSSIWSHTPSISTIRVGKHNQQHTTDESGFRVTGIEPTSPVENRKYIVLLGDSFTYGDVVHNHQTTAA